MEPEALLCLAFLDYILQLFPGLPVQHFWTETTERHAWVSSCQNLGTHPETGAGKQCKNINKGMTGVKHKWGTSFFCPTNTSNRLCALKIPSESLSSFCQLGNKSLFKTDVCNSTMCKYEFSVDCSEGDRPLTTTSEVIKICPRILLDMYSSAFCFFTKVLVMLRFFKFTYDKGMMFKINSMHWKKYKPFKIFFQLKYWEWSLLSLQKLLWILVLAPTGYRNSLLKVSRWLPNGSWFQRKNLGFCMEEINISST